MPKFTYVAVGPDGRTVSGVHTDKNLTLAEQALTARALRLTRLEQKPNLLAFEITTSRVKAADLMHFSRQLSAFLRAGIPILDALAVLTSETDRAALKRVLTEISEDLRGGARLSESIDRHPRDFPEWYRGILRSAELTGRLDDVLDQLATYIERDVEARRKLKGALVYPAIIAAMAVLTVFVLSFFVLPKFEDFFASLDAELPLATRALLAVTRFLGSWWWLIGSLIAAAALGFLVSQRTRRGRRLWHRVLLAIPVVGEAVKYSRIERFTRLLASMVSAGVPLPDAMRVATSSLDNLIFEDALAKATTAMLQGAGLAGPIAATGLFPGVASQMIRVGEDTGTLQTQLEVAARFYEKELEYKIARVTAIIEPVIVIVMGGMVGFVAIALVSAMYGIFRSANTG